MGPGNSRRALISSLETHIRSENPDHFSNPLWRNLSPEIFQAQRTCRKTIAMKRRAARLDRSIRARDCIQRKVRILKKLIPNCESVGVERLFSQTADYILALEMRVKAMQIMVNLLSGPDDE